MFLEAERNLLDCRDNEMAVDGCLKDSKVSDEWTEWRCTGSKNA